jgi:autotransporter-associated beta strand protein
MNSSRMQYNTKRLLTALAFCAVGTLAASADETWVGGTGSFLDTTKWSGGAVPISGDIATIGDGEALLDDSTMATQTIAELRVGTNQLAKGSFILANGALKANYIRQGFGNGSWGDIAQSNGLIQITSTWSDPALSIGHYPTNGVVAGTTSTYYMAGGTFDNGTGGNVHVGRYGNGHLVQTGGSILTHQCWFSIGRFATGVGVYDLSGGLYYDDNALAGGRSVIVGEDGKGTLNVSGTGRFQTNGGLLLGHGGATLSGNGEIYVRFIGDRSSDSAARLAVNGGTIGTFGTGVYENFLPALTGGVTIGNNGVTFDITDANAVTVAAALLAADGADAGSLTKKGTGILTLTGVNTYKGSTLVNEGTLVITSASAIPGPMSVASGAGLSVTPSLLYFATNGTMAAGSNIGIDTRNGSEVVDSAINVPEGGKFLKTGANTLTLTGANTYTGDTVIYGGILYADKGATGIPDASHIVLAGGSWAPQTAGIVTQGIGTTSGELSGMKGRTSGFAAIGAPLTVNMGGDGRTVSIGDNNFASGGLLLNDTGADNALTFVNGLDLTNIGLALAINSTASGAGVTITGPITAPANDTLNAHLFVRTGAGPLTLKGNVDMQMDSMYLNAAANTFDGNTLKVKNLYQSYGSSLTFANGAFVESESDTVVGWYAGNLCTLTVPEGTGLCCTNWFYMAQDANTSARLNLNGGTINANHGILGNKGTANIYQTAGSFTVRSNEPALGEYDNDTKLVGRGYYNLSGGSFMACNNFQIGRYGYGEINQTGGSLTCSNWLSIARYDNSQGLYNLNGGTLSQINSTCGLVVGEQGFGTLNVGGTGAADVNFLRLSQTAGSKSIVNLNEGGTIAANYIYMSNATTNGALFNWNGGTIKAKSSTPALLRGITSLNISEKGGILDTAGYDVGILAPLSSGISTGTFTKKGAGTLSVLNLPPSSGKTVVQEGTLKLLSPASGLVHRWSFNGSLADSVGGQTASAIGSCTYQDANQILLAGGDKGTSYVDLGANVLPADGSPVTIEIWATDLSIQTWARIFDFGLDQTSYIMMSWNRNGQIGQDTVEVKNVGAVNDTLAPYTLGTQYHICLVIENYSSNGSSKLTVYKQDAVTGATIKKTTLSLGAWTPANVTQSNCWLGHSQWPDKDANALYNECRIWKGALTEAQLTANALLGPDAVPAEITDLDSGTVLATNVTDEVIANDYLLHRWSFNGNLNDSIGGQTAAYLGSASLAYNTPGTAVSLAGGNNGTSYIDLGDNILPEDGSPCTIEIWGTNRKLQNWSRIFDLGSAPGNNQNFMMSWTRGTDVNTDRVENNGYFINDSSMTPYTLNTEFHISMVLIPDVANNQTAVKWYKHDTFTGRLLKSGAATNSNWLISTLIQSNCWLGHSEYAGDSDAAADYNECRIWKAALSETQLAKNALIGPDALPVLTASASIQSPVVQVNDGAVLDLNASTLTQKTVTGSGTVQNGTLAVTGTIEPDGVLTLTSDAVISGTYKVDAGDLLDGTGKIDLTNATLHVNDLSTLSGVWTIATGNIVGRFKATNLDGTGFGVAYTATSVKIIPLATLIIVQ